MTSILQRISAGDESAVAACLDEYGGLVWRLARRYLDRANSEVEDAVQEVFIEVWSSAKRFDPAQGSEAAFVATLAHRRLIDCQRRTSARRRHAMAVEPKPLGEPPAALARMQKSGAWEEVAAEFDRLPDDERKALWLSVHGGLSHSQIAQATASPVGTVKTRLRRALLRMHKSLRPALESETASWGGES